MKSLEIIQTQIAVLSAQLDTQEPNEDHIEKQIEDLKIVENDLKELEKITNQEQLTVEEALEKFKTREWKVIKMPEGCYERYHLRSNGESTEITIFKSAAYEITTPGSTHKQLLSFEEHQLLHKLLKAMKKEDQ